MKAMPKNDNLQIQPSDNKSLAASRTRLATACSRIFATTFPSQTALSFASKIVCMPDSHWQVFLTVFPHQKNSLLHFKALNSASNAFVRLPHYPGKIWPNVQLPIRFVRNTNVRVTEMHFVVALKPSNFIGLELKVVGKNGQILFGFAFIFPGKFNQQFPEFQSIDEGDAPANNNINIRILFLFQLNGRNARQIRRLLRMIYSQKHLYLVHVDSRQQFLQSG
jgi:hypothetical protein